MIILPNNCRCSDLSVYPKNWKTSKSDMNVAWYISYRFYDPQFPKPKLVSIRGMNDIKDRRERQQMTKNFLEQEKDLLVNQGFNPFSKTIEATAGEELSESTPLLQALKAAKDNLQCSTRTKNEIRKAMEYIERAIGQLGYQSLKVIQVKRRHVRFILDRIGKNKGGWTAPNFNHYRSYMMMLFDELQELEVAEVDFSKIKKKKTVRRIRETLTSDQRVKVNKFLLEKHYSFWRFVQIFFHSGARIAELVRVRAEDIDLAGQRYRLIIRKGIQHAEVWKTIKDVALPLWEEIMKEAGPEDFLFSKYLRPGAVQISEHQITKRWRIHVKGEKDLAITASLYSLKHLNSTETVDVLSEKDAAAQNSHAGQSMVIKIYDTKQAQRQHDRLKKVNNPFA